MRSPAALVVLSVLLAPLAAACGNGGTGVGTAPPNSSGCPADPDSVAGQPCSVVLVCSYPVCDGGSCPTTTKVAYCAGGTGAKWVVTTPSDAGGLVDTGITVLDSGTDAASDADASDATSDADASDATFDATDAVSDDAGDAASDATSDAAADASDAD